MNLNLTVLGQAISFSIFVWFCMKYVWPPIIDGLRERQERIARGLADAEKSSQKREEAEAEIATMLQDAKAQAAEIVAQAQKRARDLEEEEKAGAREGLRKQVGTLAVEGARRILGTEIDKSAHDKVIDDLVRQI